MRLLSAISSSVYRRLIPSKSASRDACFSGPFSAGAAAGAAAEDSDAEGAAAGAAGAATGTSRSRKAPMVTVSPAANSVAEVIGPC